MIGTTLMITLCMTIVSKILLEQEVIPFVLEDQTIVLMILLEQDGILFAREDQLIALGIVE